MPRAVPTDDAATRSRRTTVALGTTLFLAFFDAAALLPTIAPRAAELGAGPFGVGLAVGVYSATNLPANVLGGVLLDRVGRRRLTMLGFLLSALAVLGYGVVESVPLFVAVRAAHGVAGGLLVTSAFAITGDRTRAGGAGRSFGRYGALVGLVWVIGPGTAAAVQASSGTGTVFRVVAGLLVVGALVVRVGIRDVARVDPTLDPSSDPRAVLGPDGRPIDPARALRELASRRPVRRALLATVVWLAAVGVLAAFLRDVVTAVGAPESLVGALFSAYAVVAALVMLSPLAGRVDAGRAESAITLGLTCIGAALLTMAWASGLWQLLVASALFGAGYGLVFPAATGAISLAASTATRGRAFGLFNAAFSLGLALGPPLAGALAANAPALDPPFVPTGVLVLLAAIALRATGRGRPPGTDADAA